MKLIYTFSIWKNFRIVEMGFQWEQQLEQADDKKKREHVEKFQPKIRRSEGWEEAVESKAGDLHLMKLRGKEEREGGRREGREHENTDGL